MKSICVIGAGVSGLVAAKVFSEDGFEVQVIERDSDIGGTWAASRSYPGLRTNNSKQTYEFSDFEYPGNTDEFPYAEDVRSYLESYAKHFGIDKFIRLNQEVIDVSRSKADENRFSVTLQYKDSGLEEAPLDVDFVAVCNGVYHIPHIPVFERLEDFHGRVLHSSEVSDSTYRPGDRVVVVGGGKSAFDCAAWAAGQSLVPTLLYRRPQWMAPRYLPGGRIPGDWLVTSRLMSSFLRYYHQSRVERFMHSFGKPLVNLWWGLTALGWRKDLKIPKELIPEERLPAGLEKVGVGGDFYDAVNAGEAKTVCGEIRQFYAEGVELKDGTVLPADVLVFATGWQQSASFLSEELRNEVFANGVARLYRQILPPNVRNLGFVGYASSFSCQVTSEIAAHWLSECFFGTLPLPPVSGMEEEIDRVHRWANKYLPNRGTEGFIGPHISHYIDDLLRDMEIPTRRSGKFFEEYCTAFRASRFKGLSEERRRARA